MGTLPGTQQTTVNLMSPAVASWMASAFTVPAFPCVSALSESLPNSLSQSWCLPFLCLISLPSEYKLPAETSVSLALKHLGATLRKNKEGVKGRVPSANENSPWQAQSGFPLSVSFWALVTHHYSSSSPFPASGRLDGHRV